MIWYWRCPDCSESGSESFMVDECPNCGTRVDVSDEPPGAGRDPAGRPDPKTHPEFWSE